MEVDIHIPKQELTSILTTALALTSISTFEVKKLNSHKSVIFQASALKSWMEVDIYIS